MEASDLFGIWAMVLRMIQSLLRSRLFQCLGAIALITACGGSKATTSSTPRETKTSDVLSHDEMVGLCVRLHKEAVPCASEFVSLNLDLRMQYSPEFAEALKDPAVRAQAQAEGVKETAADGANAAERCEEFAQPQWGPAAPRSDLAALDACYAKASCSDKMACLRPIIEPRFAYRAKTAGGPQ